MGIWNFYQDVEKFDKISKDKQNEIIELMLSDEAVKYYHYTSMLSNLLNFITNEVIVLKLFDHFIEKGGIIALDDDSYIIIYQVCEKVKNKQSIKDIVTNSKYKKLHRAFLLLDDRTEKEEELGLRALADIKCAPDILYTKKYKPSFEAMKKLPPITRLKVLEALSGNTSIAYNIFENFTDEDEFRALLFGSVLRHRDRVEVMCEKYNEMKDLGKEATVLIKCTCKNCGEYEILIKSTRVRTRTGLDTTRIGGWILRDSCSLCGCRGKNEKQIIYKTE